MVDVRKFARDLIENTGNVDADFKRYMDMLPTNEKENIESESWRLEKIKTRFEERDIALYHEFNVWHRVLTSKLLFKHYQVLPARPVCFDLAQEATRRDGEDPELVVFADYMRPTKRVERYQVIDPASKSGKCIREEIFIPEVRQEDLPSYNMKRAIVGKEVEAFDRDKSCFKLWHKDTSKSLEQCYTNDFMYWKAPKFIKDAEDLQRVIDLIIEHYADIKKIYTTLLSSDGYPSIGLNEFTLFARQANILDGTIPLATVDRMFIAVNVG